MNAIKLIDQERHLDMEAELISILYLSTCLSKNPKATYEAQTKKGKKNKPTHIQKTEQKLL
jgi:hypothetical protein